MAARRFRTAAALLLAGSIGPALADCRDTYPDLRVAETVADPRYQTCDAVAQDYAAFLVKQASLLAALRPPYQRKLSDGQADEAQVQQRLLEYDDNIARLVVVAGALGKIPPASAASGASAAASAASGRALARGTLAESRTLSQALSDRIAIALRKFNAAESADYCKQNFLFRVNAELRTKLAACLRGD